MYKRIFNFMLYTIKIKKQGTYLLAIKLSFYKSYYKSTIEKARVACSN